jgi:predicted nucleic acid-binding Zn ribbon protein
MASDERPYDPTAERFFPKGDFPQSDPHLGEGDTGPSWYDAPPDEPAPTRDAGRPNREAGRANREGRPNREAGRANREGRPNPEAGRDGDWQHARRPDERRSAAESGPEAGVDQGEAGPAPQEGAAANPRRRGGGSNTGRRPRGYSGPGPDPRDPQLFGDVLGRLMKARGWEKPKAEATVFAAWERVVGPDIAQHSRPVKLDGGVLTVEAESTAWATQLRMLSTQVLARIATELGPDVVRRLRVRGPTAPDWRHGPLRVTGRGPRDTYG